MLQVAASPPSDVAGLAALDQEVLALEAVLADVQQRLQTEGCDVPNADKQLTMESHQMQAVVPAAEQALLPAETGTAQAQCKQPGVPDATVTCKHDSPDCCCAQKPIAGQQKVAPDHARQAMLCGTAGSLADIDAVMQARGYRSSQCHAEAQLSSHAVQALLCSANALLCTTNPCRMLLCYICFGVCSIVST